MSNANREAASRAVRIGRLSLVDGLEPRRLMSAAAVMYNGQSVMAEEGRWILAAKNVRVERVDGLLSKVGGSVVRSLGIGGELLLEVPTEVTQGEIERALGRLGRRAQLVPDELLQASATVNDPYLGSQYWIGAVGTGKVNTATAWDLGQGSGVIVAVVDTGVDLSHPDLTGKIFVNTGEVAGDGIDNDGNGYVDDVNGWDFANNDNNPTDDNGHGTHVAGLIGAATNNGVGVAGVGYEATILPLKFLAANGNGSLSAAVSALNYAAMMKTQEGFNIRVVNNSWGGSGTVSSLSTAFTTLQNAGILSVVAAGNGGADHVGDNNDLVPNYPSNYPHAGILAVAATDPNDNLAGFSNYGLTSVDLGAPGVGNLSTIRGGSYGYMSGTSMATPVVAGAAALLFSIKPGATYGEVKSALMNNVDPVASLAGKTVTGGRLNAGRAAQALAATLVTVPAAPVTASAVVTEGAGPKAVTVSWTDTATNETGYKVFRSAGGGAYDEVALLGAGATSSIDSAVSEGVAYAYKVRATNSAGDSADSPVAVVTVPETLEPLGAPVNLQGVLVNGAPVLTWVDRASAEAGFRVYARRAGKGEATLVATLNGADVLSWRGPGISVATTYEVRAFNGSGESTSSNAVTLTPTAGGRGGEGGSGGDSNGGKRDFVAAPRLAGLVSRSAGSLRSARVLQSGGELRSAAPSVGGSLFSAVPVDGAGRELFA